MGMSKNRNIKKKKTTQNKKFRIRSKTLYCTYPTIPVLPLKKSDYGLVIYELLKRKLKDIDKYLVVVKKKGKNDDLQVECFFKRNRRFEVYSKKALDLDFEDCFRIQKNITEIKKCREVLEDYQGGSFIIEGEYR